jgi:hypothetical protein
MKLIKLLTSFFIALFTIASAYAAPVKCPIPSPFATNTPTTISPKTPYAETEIFYWVPGITFELESYTASRIGNTIYLTSYIFFSDDGTPGQNPDCVKMSLGILPAGEYQIVWTSYIRRVGSGYLAPPSVGNLPSFTVLPLPVVPIQKAAISLLILLISIAVFIRRRITTRTLSLYFLCVFFYHCLVRKPMLISLLHQRELLHINSEC